MSEDIINYFCMLPNEIIQTIILKLPLEYSVSMYHVNSHIRKILDSESFVKSAVYKLNQTQDCETKLNKKDNKMYSEKIKCITFYQSVTLCLSRYSPVKIYKIYNTFKLTKLPLSYFDDVLVISKFMVVPNISEFVCSLSLVIDFLEEISKRRGMSLEKIIKNVSLANKDPPPIVGNYVLLKNPLVNNYSRKKNCFYGRIYTKLARSELYFLLQVNNFNPNYYIQSSTEKIWNAIVIKQNFLNKHYNIIYTNILQNN